MSVSIGSPLYAAGAANPLHAVAGAQANASQAWNNSSGSATSVMGSPGLNSLSDQPLSPQVMKELMHLYASIHGN